MVKEEEFFMILLNKLNKLELCDCLSHKLKHASRLLIRIKNKENLQLHPFSNKEKIIGTEQISRADMALLLAHDELFGHSLIGSLRNHDDDGNKNVTNFHI